MVKYNLLLCLKQFFKKKISQSEILRSMFTNLEAKTDLSKARKIFAYFTNQYFKTTLYNNFHDSQPSIKFHYLPSTLEVHLRIS